MRRWTLHITTALSLLLMLAVVGLWVRSYSSTLGIALSPKKDSSLYIESSCGRLGFHYFSNPQYHLPFFSEEQKGSFSWLNHFEFLTGRTTIQLAVTDRPSGVLAALGLVGR